MKIGIDIDDVTAEYVKGLTQLYNKVYNEQLSHDDIRGWDLKASYEKTGTPESVKALMDLYIQSGALLEAEEVPGATASIRALLAQGHDVYFISARGSRAIDSTYRWFYSHGLPLNNIYFNRDKAWLVDKLGIDAFVDDGVHNLDNIASVCGNRCVTIIYDRPWNRTTSSKYAHHRARDWKHVTKILEECT